MAFSVIETTRMEWRGFPDIPGFKEKPLAYDPASRSRRMLWHLPPGWGEDVIPEEAMLHYHRSVHERALVLFGDFPHWEFNGFDDLEGYVKVMRPGLFMDRPPMSLHGLKPGHISEIGATILYWNTGPGTSIAEDGYADESVDVIAARRDTKIDAAFRDVRLLDTDEMAWQPHPAVSGWKVKPLAGEAQGADEVALVYLPKEVAAADRATSAPVPAARPWLFVLAGAMTAELDGEPVSLRAGDHAEWSGTSRLAAAAAADETGCLLLCVGHALAA